MSVFASRRSSNAPSSWRMPKTLIEVASTVLCGAMEGNEGDTYKSPTVEDPNRVLRGQVIVGVPVTECVEVSDSIKGPGARTLVYGGTDGMRFEVIAHGLFRHEFTKAVTSAPAAIRFIGRFLPQRPGQTLRQFQVFAIGESTPLKADQFWKLGETPDFSKTAVKSSKKASKSAKSSTKQAPTTTTPSTDEMAAL